MIDEHEHAPAMTEPAVSDLDLRSIIEEALWSLDSIRVSKPAIEVSVANGHATVSGIVASPMMREQIEEVLSGLPVTIAVMDDAAIQNAVAYALAMDPRTASIPPGYRVTPYNGHIHVKGKLTPEEAEAAWAVASAVKGVRGVTIN